VAAAPIIGVAVGAASTVSSIAQRNREARAQREQIQAQRVALNDQRIINEYTVNEQRRQTEASYQRERELAEQARTLGLLQNEMQAAQQQIAQTQAQIMNDQAAFVNKQRELAREAQANIQATETLRQLNEAEAKKRAEDAKLIDEADAIALQRSFLQGNGGDTASKAALYERAANALASNAIEGTSLFNNEQDDAARQLAYEKAVASLERQLGDVGVLSQRDAIQRGALLNEIQRKANAADINTQTERNLSALDYARASKNALYSIGQLSSNAQLDAQSRALKAQRRMTRGSTFGDWLGAFGNLGLSLYQTGIFNTKPASPYRIMDSVRLTPYDAGILSTPSLDGTLGIDTPPFQYLYPGANDATYLRNIG